MTFKPRGEHHHKAKLSDHEVWLVRTLASEAISAGRPREEVFRWLAEKFELHPRTIKKYVYWESRTGGEEAD